MQCFALNVVQNTNESTVDTSAVHVSTHGWHVYASLNTLIEPLLGQTHKGLLNSFVTQRLGVVHITEFGWNISKCWRVRVGNVVIVQHSGVRLGDKLAGWCVESHVVKSIEWGLADLLLCDTISIGVAVGLGVQCGLTLVVCLVTSINGLGVALDGEVTIDDRVLAGQVWLVKVICVLHVTSTKSLLHHNWRIRANQHGDHTGATGWARGTLGVQGDIASNNQSISSIPSRRLDPVDGIKDGVGATVASIDSINALDVGVVTEELHKNRLDGLGLVENGLGTDFQATNGVGVNVVLAQEAGGNGKGERVDVCRALVAYIPRLCILLTLSVVTEAHPRLAKTNCVFALANAIELLELGLLNAL